MSKRKTPRQFRIKQANNPPKSEEAKLNFEKYNRKKK
jgi:hypothetical protein